MSSFVYGSAIAAFVNALYLLANTAALRLFPRAGATGEASWNLFKEVFAYGKDLFFVALGTQLIMASQTIIVARVLGLQVAAAWAIGTRVLTLLFQVIWRISDSASVTLAEVIARGEKERLRSRYSELVILSALIGGMWP